MDDEKEVKTQTKQQQRDTHLNEWNGQTNEKKE